MLSGIFTFGYKEIATVACTKWIISTASINWIILIILDFDRIQFKGFKPFAQPSVMIKKTKPTLKIFSDSTSERPFFSQQEPVSEEYRHMTFNLHCLESFVLCWVNTYQPFRLFTWYNDVRNRVTLSSSCFCLNHSLFSYATQNFVMSSELRFRT